MGLDQYAYVATRANQQRDFYDGAQWDENAKELVNPNESKPREIAYWRKHPNLQGWMEQLWIKKISKAGGSAVEDGENDPTFNGIEVELTWQDLDDLERAVTHEQLPSTSGFFFGDDSDEYYRERDLEFIKNARAELFVGLKVFYNSSW